MDLSSAVPVDTLVLILEVVVEEEEAWFWEDGCRGGRGRTGREEDEDSSMREDADFRIELRCAFPSAVVSVGGALRLAAVEGGAGEGSSNASNMSSRSLMIGGMRLMGQWVWVILTGNPGGVKVFVLCARFLELRVWGVRSVGFGIARGERKRQKTFSENQDDLRKNKVW